MKFCADCGRPLDDTGACLRCTIQEVGETAKSALQSFGSAALLIRDGIVALQSLNPKKKD